jgi:DNA-binding transcriptional LysR family regulator
VPLGLFAHRDYLARHGTPSALEDLRSHILIGADRDPTFLAALNQFGGLLSRRNFRLRCDSEAAQIAALRQGSGSRCVRRALLPEIPLSCRCWTSLCALSSTAG